GEVFNPIGQTKDFMDHDHGRGFLFHFGIDDEAIHLAVVIFDLDPFAVASGFFELLLGPVLGDSAGRPSGSENDDRSDEQRLGKRMFHGELPRVWNDEGRITKQESDTDHRSPAAHFFSAMQYKCSFPRRNNSFPTKAGEASIGSSSTFVAST